MFRRECRTSHPFRRSNTLSTRPDTALREPADSRCVSRALSKKNVSNRPASRQASMQSPAGSEFQPGVAGASAMRDPGRISQSGLACMEDSVQRRCDDASDVGAFPVSRPVKCRVDVGACPLPPATSWFRVFERVVRRRHLHGARRLTGLHTACSTSTGPGAD